MTLKELNLILDRVKSLADPWSSKNKGGGSKTQSSSGGELPASTGPNIALYAIGIVLVILTMLIVIKIIRR